MIRVSKALELLKVNSINIDNDFELTSLTSLEGGKNCIAFCKSDLDIFIDKFDECLILSKKDCINPGNNIVVVVDDPRYSFAELISKCNVYELYNKPNLMDYRTILKKSRIVSKTAKIYNAEVGKGCSFHHNVLVGVDDFCPIQSPDGNTRLMFPQVGYVKLGDRVEIFNNSIVGRGALCTTEIGDDTKIDALCQIGHNCKIGKNCMICAGTIIAGSCTIGDNVFIGIGSNIRNGILIGNNVTIAQGSNVVKDIPNNAVVAGNPARVIRMNDNNHQATMVP